MRTPATKAGHAPAPRYQLFPPLSVDERSALRQDIAARGVLIPVEVDDEGIVMDGHHRVEIADELGIEYPVVVRSGMTEAEKLEHIFALNYARRSLSKDDRQTVIAVCRKRGMSLRAIAAVVGVDHETVRRDLAGANAPPELEQATEPEPDPLPPQPTLAERIAELSAEGATQRGIAAELGVSAGTVHNLLHKRTDRTRLVDQPAAWPATRSLVKELKAFAASDPRQVAASIPDRSRHAYARQLRHVGTFLGSIALELERNAR
jgi:DNA-binding CsgD family transcriptional regulator